MPTSDFKLVHVSPRVQARGGVEALHLHHRELKVPQQFVALFDREPQSWTNYTNLNFNWRTPLWKMRMEFRKALAAHAGSIVIYHHVWGLPLFHDVDGAARRVAYCLGMPSYHERDLRASRGLVDGALAITSSLNACWRVTLPELTPERMGVIPAPVVVPPGFSSDRVSRDEIVLGYAGRVERRHKRLDRLPAFLRELRATGRKFRFEVLGDGALRAQLQRELGSAVTFHGWTTKQEFWRVMSGWDAVVFFSDMEGGPIALLEGAAVGAIPFFPAIGGSQGDECAAQIDQRCLYPPGDLRTLARNVDGVFGQSLSEIARLRVRAETVTARHQGGRYETELMRFTRAIAALPRVSAIRPRRPRIMDALPLGIVTRIAPWALRSS